LEPDVVNPVTGTSQNIFFLTMEFLEGETLADRIARTGALPNDEAFTIAQQIANALSCAHDHGIVHGDIKPANVMLVRRGGAPSDGERGRSIDVRVVITDFGLARIDPLFRTREFSTALGSILPGGTLAYMAPEQLEGSVISSATDIYAFGLVLFEMVTGQRAFSSSNLLAGIAQRLIQPAALLLTLVSALPAPWRQAIEGCLHSNPSERLENAATVISVLEGKRVGSGTSRWFAALEWPLWRRLSAAAGIFAIALALFAGGLRLYQSKADSKVGPGALIYLPGAKNQTKEKFFDHLTELIQSGLGQSVQVNLLDQGRVGDILQQMKKAPAITIDAPTARQIAMRAGAVRVIFVTVEGSGGNYSLDVDIQQSDPVSPDRYREHWTRGFAWHGSAATNPQGMIPTDLLTAIRNASDWIRHEVGESSNDIARLNVPPESVTTSSWAALEDYAEGETLVRADQRENAVIMLQHAVENDQDFALAWGRMGDILLSLHRDEEGYKAYDKALDAAQKSRLTRKEEDRIRGMRAVDTADYQLAVDAFHDYTVYYPNDYVGWIYPMRPLRMLGRDEEAIANLRRAIALNSTGAFANYSLAQELILQGRNDEARDSARGLRSKYPDLADRIDVILFLLNGQYDQAAKAASDSQATADPLRRSYGYQIQASIAADRGDYRHAIEYLNRGLDEDRQGNSAQRFWKLLDRAYIESRVGEFDNCLRDVHAALDASASPLMISTADTVLGAAYIDSPPRDHELIRRELARIDHMLVVSEGDGAIFEFARLRTRGEILLAEGKPKAAVEVFQRAAIKDAPVESREYLGRALLALAASEHSSAASDNLRRMALKAYSATALRPALIWCDSGTYLPGFYADQLQSYVQIARDLGSKNDDAIAAEAKLASLRREPDTH
jgi:hypothetical protein